MNFFVKVRHVKFQEGFSVVRVFCVFFCLRGPIISCNLFFNSNLKPGQWLDVGFQVFSNFDRFWCLNELSAFACFLAQNDLGPCIEIDPWELYFIDRKRNSLGHFEFCKSNDLTRLPKMNRCKCDLRNIIAMQS